MYILSRIFIERNMNLFFQIANSKINNGSTKKGASFNFYYAAARHF